jgi:hypothetical protein
MLTAFISRHSERSRRMLTQEEGVEITALRKRGGRSRSSPGTWGSAVTRSKRTPAANAAQDDDSRWRPTPSSPTSSTSASGSATTRTSGGARSTTIFAASAPDQARSVVAAGMSLEERPNTLAVPAVGERAGQRHPLPVERAPQDWRSASGRPGPSDDREEREARLVLEDDRGLLACGVLLTSDQVSLTQRSIAPSFRSKARRAGFCRLQPICRSSRWTCPGWYSTPVSIAITLATRSSVQSSVGKPFASAPFSKRRSTRFRSAPVSSGGRPGPLRLLQGGHGAFPPGAMPAADALPGHTWSALAWLRPYRNSVADAGGAPPWRRGLFSDAREQASNVLPDASWNVCRDALDGHPRNRPLVTRLRESL